MSRPRLTAALLASVLVPSTALASPDTTFDPLSMDRQTFRSTVNVDFGYEFWDDPPLVNDITVFGLTIAGQYMAPSGVGGYAAIPLSYVSIDSPLFDDSEFAVGNIELGGVYAKKVRHNTSLVFHAGVALPTADDDGAGGLQAYASVPRYGDLVQRWPNSTWLRLGFSPMGREGKLFWRADVGLDFALDDDNGGGDISPILRLNIGGGIDLGSVSLLGELVTNIVDSDGDDTASTFTLGARFASGNLRPGIGLLFPIGFENQNGQQNEYLDFALIASLAVLLDPS